MPLVTPLSWFPQGALLPNLSYSHTVDHDDHDDDGGDDHDDDDGHDDHDDEVGDDDDYDLFVFQGNLE